MTHSRCVRTAWSISCSTQFTLSTITPLPPLTSIHYILGRVDDTSNLMMVPVFIHSFRLRQPSRRRHFNHRPVHPLLNCPLMFISLIMKYCAANLTFKCAQQNSPTTVPSTLILVNQRAFICQPMTQILAVQCRFLCLPHLLLLPRTCLPLLPMRPLLQQSYRKTCLHSKQQQQQHYLYNWRKRST